MNFNLVFATLCALAAAGVHAEIVNFDNDKTGEPPRGWTTTKTGQDEPKWTVVADASAPSKPNVLKQSGEATYPVYFKNDTSLKDAFVDVTFKPVSGKEDQAGGLWTKADSVTLFDDFRYEGK